MPADSQNSVFRIGFFILIVFAFSRPLSLIFTRVRIGPLSVFELFGVGISYILLLVILMNIRRLRLDRTILLAILFSAYCATSLLWDSEPSIFARLTLPFLVFISVRIFIVDSRQITAILLSLFLGYLIPIALSAHDLLAGKAFSEADYYSGLSRFSGAYAGIHTLAYAMLFFSFLYCQINWKVQIRGYMAKLGLVLLLLISSLCLYKTYARTVLFGFLLYWLIFLWGYRKKFFFAAVVVCCLLGIIASQRIETVIWKTDEYDTNKASSGRLTLWNHNIKLFLNSSLPQQLLGRGLGVESESVIGSDTDVWSSHNDYISLLMTIGLIGLFLYLLLLVSLMWDIFLSNLDKKIKYLFGAILISVSIMNFFSNAVIFRLELSQYFWLFMGFFYKADEIFEEA